MPNHRENSEEAPRRPATAPPSEGGEVPSRPSPVGRLGLARRLRAWSGRAADWLDAASAALRGARGGEEAVHEFAAIASGARSDSEIDEALLRLAREVAGAGYVELVRDDAGAAPRLEIHRPEAADPGGPASPPPPPPALRLPVGSGEDRRGTLVVTPPGPRPPSAAEVRRLKTLCAIAAAACRGARADRPAPSRAGLSGVPALRDAAFLRSFLPYALAQARRRGEPLTLLYVGVDRLGAIRDLLGGGLAEAAADRVAGAVVSALRASDVVVRLDDGRVVAVLPDAGHEDAPTVAEAVREAVSRAGAPSKEMPLITASIGVASYPYHARDLVSLNLAASDALAHAARLGRNRVVTSAERPGRPELSIVPCTG